MPLSNQLEPTDSILIERSIAGDHDAYGQLVTRYQKKIFRVALAILRDHGKADAATQDTFVQAYLSLDKFEGRAGFETWLTRIAINKSRDSLRARTWLSLTHPPENDRLLYLVEPADDGPDAERTLLSRQLHDEIDRAVASLSSQQRVIFSLKHYEEKSLEEIADYLDLKPGTVRAHMFRAMHKLREKLAHWSTTIERKGLQK